MTRRRGGRLETAALVGWGVPIAFQTDSALLPILLESLIFGGVFGALYLWRRLRLERTDF